MDYNGALNLFIIGCLFIEALAVPAIGSVSSTGSATIGSVSSTNSATMGGASNTTSTTIGSQPTTPIHVDTNKNQKGLNNGQVAVGARDEPRILKGWGLGAGGSKFG